MPTHLNIDFPSTAQVPAARAGDDDGMGPAGAIPPAVWMIAFLIIGYLTVRALVED